jgi:hypothetical protein
MKTKKVLQALFMCFCTIIITSCNSNKFDREKLSVVLSKYDSFRGDFEEGFLRVRKDGKYGVIDKSGKEIVPCRYADIRPFSEGMAGVTYEENGKRGFINKKGDEVIPFLYDALYNDAFSEGLVQVCKDGKYGFIDKTGKEIVPLKYAYVYPFSEGMAIVAVDDGYDKYGRWKSKYGFVDKTGKEVIPCIYDKACPFSEGLACVQKNDKCGFIDKEGKEIIPFYYNEIGEGEGANDEYFIYFKDGLAILRISGSAYGGKEKCGVIDKSGKVIIPFKHNVLRQFQNGLFVYKNNKKEGVIDGIGNEVFPCIYDHIIPTTDNYFIVTSNDKVGLLDKTGNVILPFEYENLGYVRALQIETESSDYWREEPSFQNGLIEAQKNEKWGFIDETGKSVIPFVFDSYYSIGNFHDGLASVYWNNQSGFIDREGYFIGKGIVKKLSE